MKILLKRRAEREFLELPLHLQRRFRTALDDLARDWPLDHRCLFEVQGEFLLVTAFVGRSTAYR